MDPNATVAELEAARTAYINGEMESTEYRKYVAERYAALRAWHRAGGFAPRGGYPRPIAIAIGIR